MCFKTAKRNVNSLGGEPNYDSDESDINDRVFLGTLIAEHCPDANIDSNQITCINTQQDSNKA